MSLERSPEDGHAELSPRRLAEGRIIRLVADETGIPEDEWQMIPPGMAEPFTADDERPQLEYAALAAWVAPDSKRPEVIYVLWSNREQGEYNDFIHCPHEPRMPRQQEQPEKRSMLSPKRMIAAMGCVVLVAVLAILAASRSNAPQLTKPLGPPAPGKIKDPVRGRLPEKPLPFHEHNDKIPFDQWNEQFKGDQKDRSRTKGFELRLP